MKKLKKTRLIFSVFAMLIAAVTISVIAVCINNANADILLSELGSNAAPAQEQPSVLPESSLVVDESADDSSLFNLYVPTEYLEEDGINDPNNPITQFLNKLNSQNLKEGEIWTLIRTTPDYAIQLRNSEGTHQINDYPVPYVQGLYSSVYATTNEIYQTDSLNVILSNTPIRPTLFEEGEYVAARINSTMFFDAIPRRPGLIFDEWKVINISDEDTVDVWPRNPADGLDIFSDQFYHCYIRPYGQEGNVSGGTITIGGSPASNVTVRFVPDDGEQVYTAVSNQDGSYYLTMPEFQDGTITVFGGNCKIEIRSVTAEDLEDGNINFELEKITSPISLSGNIVGYREGAEDEEFPVPNAILYFYQQDNPITMAVSDYAGNYRITVPANEAGNLVCLYNGFMPEAISYPDPIDVPKTDQNFKLQQQTDESVVMYFSVFGEYALLTKNGGPETSVAADLYSKDGCSYHYDWFTGDIFVAEDDGKNDVYKVFPKPGWAFYDWHILNWQNEPVDLQLNAKVDENLFFYGHFKEAGQLTFASADTDKHQGFNIEISSNEENFPGVNMDETEYAAFLYEGTEVTFENGYLKTHCEVTENDEHTYIEEYKITPVAQEGYEFDQWYRFGEPVAEGTTLTIQQFDDFPITVSYKVPTPQPVPDPDPVPGGDPGLIAEASYNINSTADTGDNNYLYIMAFLMIAACSCLVFLRRTWKIK